MSALMLAMLAGYVLASCSMDTSIPLTSIRLHNNDENR